MSDWANHYDARVRFWQYLEERVKNMTRGQKNKAAYALCNALDEVFTPCEQMQDLVPVNRALLQYLAGWARESLEGDPQGGVFGPHPNHFLSRAYDGFFETVRSAIKEDRVRLIDSGRVLYGCLELPLWLVEKYTKEANEEAENFRALLKTHPVRFRPMLVHTQE